ncbi:MAG: hypothetical protein J4F50_06215 [Acidimicrobiia bacterium]|nr:hypothetical protein [Acidimicrobiia bacterium]
MEPITLTGLGAVIAAVVGPMLGCILVMMRYQHKDSAMTRDLIGEARQETRDLISGSEKETRDLISASEKETHKLIERHSREHSEGLDKVISSLADARERLARIEGHLGVGSRPPGEADPDEAEAA